MKIVLINPPQIFGHNQVTAGIVPPLGLMYLAGMIDQEFDKHHNIDIVDATGESPYHTYKFGKYMLRGLEFKTILERITEDTELIGITNLYSFAFPIVSKLCEFIKRKNPKVKIVLGGAHVTSMPKDVLESENVDFVILGEGESATIDLIKCLESKEDFSKIKGFGYKNEEKTIINSERKFIMDLDTIPFPRRDLIPMKNYFKSAEPHGTTKYKRWTTMLFSRGCPYQCTFCSTPFIWKRIWRARSAKNVVDEIEELVKNYGVKEIHFEDESMMVSKKRMHDFCDELLKRKLNIVWQASNGIRLDNLDEEVLRKMKESKCTSIILAPESGSPRVLRDIVKKDIKLSDCKKVVKICNKLKLKTTAYFILGLPGETKEDIKKSIKFSNQLAALGLDETIFGLFAPFPGCELFNKLLDEKKIVLNDKLYEDLLSVGSYIGAVSWSDITSKEIMKYQIRGYLSFYIRKVFFHPLKMVRSMINVIKGTQELKTERAINTMIKRYLRMFL